MSLTNFKMKEMVSLYVKYQGMSPSYDSGSDMNRWYDM